MKISSRRGDRTWESIRTGYAAPHEDLLRLFYRNFVSGDGDDGSMEDEYRAHWAERSAECDALVRRLAGVDVRGAAEQATGRVRIGLRALSDVDVFGVVGLGTTNACQLVYNGLPTVVLALPWTCGGRHS